MKFSCERALLVSAIQVASRAAAVKSPVPALEGLLIEAGDDKIQITGYDLKTGIITSLPGEVSESGSVVLNARLFGEIVRKMPEDTVSIAIDANQTARIESSFSEFEILGTPAADYPELPAIDRQNAISLSEKKLKSMIAQTIFAVSDNEARPIHTGALFEIEKEKLTVVTVDGYRLALKREVLDGENSMSFNFVCPGTALEEVQKIVTDSEDNISITLGSKYIVFSIKDTMLLTRRLEGDFLNYKNSIPQAYKYLIEVDRRELIDSVERVSLIINDRLKSPIRCVFDEGVLKLNTVSALGKASDECPVNGDGDHLEIGFNNRYILEALKAAPSETVKLQLTSGVAPCVIVPGGDETSEFLYMILPVRLKANEG